MSRGAVARRRRLNAEATLAVCGGVEGDDEELLDDDGARLREENARLREQVAEVEGWYRLLQADHAAVCDNERRTSRRTTELQEEANRLGLENQELQALVARLGEAGRKDEKHPRESSMNRFTNLIQGARKHKWATAAVVAIGTLALRDPAVEGLLAKAADKARQAVGERSARVSAGSGFIRYAAMINSRDQLERARKEYNEGERSLKGDALLEAQDRLRAAKVRDREARLAFLPELARECRQAKVALPREAAEALAALEAETNE